MHAESLWHQHALQVEKDTLDALFMKVSVLAKTHQIGKQAAVVQRSAAILNYYRAPVRLAGDRAVGFQQMAIDTLIDLALRVAAQ